MKATSTHEHELSDGVILGASIFLYWTLASLSDSGSNGRWRDCLWHPYIFGAVLGLALAAACLSRILFKSPPKSGKGEPDAQP